MLLTLLICAGLIGLDQLFKFLATVYVQPVGETTLIPGVLGLSYVENDGAAFSILRGQQALLIVVTGIVLLVGAYFIFVRRIQDRMEFVAIVLAFSGGVGNLIDRIARGYVVDYIQLLFVRFAVFNFADILVCAGFALLVVAVFRAEARARKAEKIGAAAEAAEAQAKEVPTPVEPSETARENADGPD